MIVYWACHIVGLQHFARDKCYLFCTMVKPDMTIHPVCTERYLFPLAVLCDLAKVSFLVDSAWLIVLLSTTISLITYFQ